MLCEMDPNLNSLNQQQKFLFVCMAACAASRLLCELGARGRSLLSPKTRGAFIDVFRILRKRGLRV